MFPTKKLIMNLGQSLIVHKKSHMLFKKMLVLFHVIFYSENTRLDRPLSSHFLDGPWSYLTS